VSAGVRERKGRWSEWWEVEQTRPVKTYCVAVHCHIHQASSLRQAPTLKHQKTIFVQLSLALISSSDLKAPNARAGESIHSLVESFQLLMPLHGHYRPSPLQPNRVQPSRPAEDHQLDGHAIRALCALQKRGRVVVFEVRVGQLFYVEVY